ncbi:MAG: TonB family protein [Allorhizobium sp.]
MSTLDPDRRRRFRVGEVLLWTAAGLVAFAVHAGAVALMLAQPEEKAASDSPPMAVMIELSPEPEAVETEENEIVPDEVDAEEVKTAAIIPLPEPVMPPLTEPPPELVVTEPVEELLPEKQVVEEPVEEAVVPPVEEPIEEIDPIEEQMLAALENVEVPLPVARPPEPVEAPKVEKPVRQTEKSAPRKKTPEPPASQAAKKAQAQVQPSTRTAAAQTSNGGGRSSVSPARWQSQLMSHLERRKRYPQGSKSKGEQGTVYVSFRIDDAGNVLSVSLSRSSGFAALDQSVIDLVRRASPVPVPPVGVNKTIVAPVRFNLR